MHPSHLSWRIISLMVIKLYIFNANHLIFTGYGISTLVATHGTFESTSITTKGFGASIENSFVNLVHVPQKDCQTTTRTFIQRGRVVWKWARLGSRLLSHVLVHPPSTLAYSSLHKAHAFRMKEPPRNRASSNGLFLLPILPCNLPKESLVLIQVIGSGWSVAQECGL